MHVIQTGPDWNQNPTNDVDLYFYNGGCLFFSCNIQHLNWLSWVSTGYPTLYYFFVVHLWIELTPLVQWSTLYNRILQKNGICHLTLHLTTGSITISTSLSWIHGWVKFQKGLSQHVTQLELCFRGEMQLVVTKRQSYCIYKNDVRKLDISLSFPDNISVIPLSWCKTNLKLSSAI